MTRQRCWNEFFDISYTQHTHKMNIYHHLIFLILILHVWNWNLLKEPAEMLLLLLLLLFFFPHGFFDNHWGCIRFSKHYFCVVLRIDAILSNFTRNCVLNYEPKNSLMWVNLARKHSFKGQIWCRKAWSASWLSKIWNKFCRWFSKTVV